ncbi:hypothetical protein GCK32_005776 [Trichostrongylus colubriformis]|uniref:Uncharacterized protein n=1 Tax=Trichostrongylus colubriformis TaxID=6319 RepID=A0AAN8ITQ0_TRICO
MCITFTPCSDPIRDRKKPPDPRNPTERKIEMESGSIFDFSGSAKQMRLKVTLIEKGLDAIYDGRSVDNMPGTSISRVVDELNLQWQQKVSSYYELGNIASQEWELFSFFFLPSNIDF